jgi:hypothetical protein
MPASVKKKHVHVYNAWRNNQNAGPLSLIR